MSVALIELVEMTATLNVVVSINSTTVMQTYWDSLILYGKLFMSAHLQNFYFLSKKGQIILSTSLDFIPLLPSDSGGVLKNTLKGIWPT